MAKQTLNNGDSGFDFRNKINENTTELYDITVKNTGNETISGVKTFSDGIVGNVTGNAGTVTNGVYISGDQTIGGVKTFTSAPVVPDATLPQHPMTLNQGVLKTQIKQTTGTSESDLMSQKAVTDELAANVGNLNTSILTEARGIVGNLFYKTNTYIHLTTGNEVSFSGASVTGFIAFDKNESITVKGRGNPAAALVAFYDKFKNFISSVGGAEYNNVLTTIPVESIPTNAVYLRATCTTANGGTLKCGMVLGNLSLIGNFQQDLKELKENLGDLFSIRANYINNSGVQTSFAEASCTPFIRINTNYTIKVKGRSNAIIALIAFYDSNKVFISSIYGKQYNNTLTTIPIESIPAGAKYVRATCTTNNTDRLLEVSVAVGLLEEINDVVDKQNSEPYINVTEKYPPVSDYHTKQSARTAIPAPFRTSGLVISYQTGANAWNKEMFIGSNVSEWVRESYWQKLNKEDVTESTTELQGDEMVLSGIQDGKEKLMPIKQIQEFFINSQNGFPQPENTLFYPSHIDLINNKWVDKSGNQNDADLVQSNCGTAKVGTIMTFNEPLEGNLEDWVLTSDGTAVPVLALDKITFSGAGIIYNLRLVNVTINKHHYYPISEGTIAVYDCSGNSKHIIVSGSTVQEWTANKQDEFHYNLKKGGGLVDNSGLVDNPTMTGTYIDGKAPGCELYNAISASEETSITIHGQAQRVVTAVVGGSLTIDGIKRKYKVGDIIKTITKVYVVSGKVNGYALNSIDFKSISVFESKTTGEWETIESYVLVASNVVPTHSVYIRATAVNTEFIVGEVKTEVISQKVIVPALENAPYDALGNALDVTPKSIFKVETGVKFPVNSELIDADVENYLFDVSQNANTIILNEDRFALKNMIFDNRIFFNPDTNQMFIFKQSLDKNSLKGLLNKWAKPSIHIYRLPSEYSLIGKEKIDVRDVNRNFRVGINLSGLLCVSNDYGKTWSVGVNYSPSDGIHHIFITSKGAVVIFYYKSVIKRMGWGENTFTSIYPVDENGNPIEMHSPVNPLWPGEYYKPYHKLLDLYDSSDNTSLIAWGTWNNNAASNGAAPQALWYSIDDMVTIKRFYYFGQNPQYTDLGTSAAGPGGVLLGDPTNPITCRHTHEFSYNKYDGKIYITCGDSHIRPELHIFETKYNKSTDTWDELVDLVDAENRNQIHRAIGIGFDKEGYFYFGSDADFVPHTHNGVEYDVQGMFKVHKDDINDISKYKLLHPAKDIVVNSYMIDDVILFSVSGQPNLVHISLNKGETWETINFEPYMREYYPFDKHVTQRSIIWFKIDSQKNIHANCNRGVYVNISIK